jgi:hypothetical protein
VSVHVYISDVSQRVQTVIKAQKCAWFRRCLET